MILSLSFLAATLMQPGAPDWRRLNGPPNRVISADAASVTRGGEITSIRLRMDYVPARQGPNSYVIARIDLRCAANEGHTGDLVNYSSDGTPGRRDTEQTPFRAISENTMLAEVRDIACGPSAR